MIICICRDVNEKEIRDLITKHDCKTIEDLQQHINICDVCHGCTFMIEQMLKDPTWTSILT